MRKTFAQVLQEGKIDIRKEYSKLYALFYEKPAYADMSIASVVAENFLKIPFRKTCLSFGEFNTMYGFDFPCYLAKPDIDYFVKFCEYIFNLTVFLNERYFKTFFSKKTCIEHIRCVIETIGYMEVSEDGVFIFVPRDNAAISVAEMDMIPATVSYKVVSYHHHSMKGDLDSKKQTLLAFADLLEPKRKELESADSKLATDLFYAFNNFNIRHNNIDPSGPKYKKPIGDLGNERLEDWYDEVYQMCLLAFMRLEHIPRKVKFDVLKDKIENKK